MELRNILRILEQQSNHMTSNGGMERSAGACVGLGIVAAAMIIAEVMKENRQAQGKVIR